MRRGQTNNESQGATQIVACSQNANQRLRPHIWHRIRPGVSSIDVTIQNGIHNPPETSVKRQFVAKLVRSRPRSCTVIDSQRKQNAFLLTIAIRFDVVLSDNGGRNRGPPMWFQLVNAPCGPPVHDMVLHFRVPATDRTAATRSIPPSIM